MAAVGHCVWLCGQTVCCCGHWVVVPSADGQTVGKYGQVVLVITGQDVVCAGQKVLTVGQEVC